MPSDAMTPEERAEFERMEGDFMCEHPLGDVERSAGRMCPDCQVIVRAAVRRAALDEVRKAENGSTD